MAKLTIAIVETEKGNMARRTYILVATAIMLAFASLATTALASGHGLHSHHHAHAAEQAARGTDQVGIVSNLMHRAMGCVEHLTGQQQHECCESPVHAVTVLPARPSRLLLWWPASNDLPTDHLRMSLTGVQPTGPPDTSPRYDDLVEISWRTILYHHSLRLRI